MGFSVFTGSSARVDVETLETLVTEAFAAWEQADCGGETTPRMVVHNLGRVLCDQAEYNQSGGNANLVIVRDGEWPYAGQGKTLALTIVTYSIDDGEIYDTDLEVNGGPDVALTTGDTGVSYDLLSILTHETGHMLGLAHTDVQGATMEVEYQLGSTDLRSLAPDDTAGICAAYPPGEIGTCDPTPRHGFKTTCGPALPEEGCGCTSAPNQMRPGWVALLIGLAGMMGWRVSRRAGRRP